MRASETTPAMTRRRHVRPRPRWSNASTVAIVSVVSIAACAWVVPGVDAHASVDRAIQGEAEVPARRRLVDALEGADATAILREIGQIDCPETIGKRIRSFLDANKAVVDACTEQTGYTLYPYGTKLPDADETSKICASLNCMDVVSGVVLAKLPECEYQRYSPRSFAETFLRVRVDIRNDRRPPTSSEFGQLYALTRVVNYLTENTTIQATVKTPFKANEVIARLNPVEVDPELVLSEGLVVMVNETAADGTTSTSGSGSAGSATTTAPTSLAPSTGSNSSEVANSANDDTNDELPGNLQMAYLFVGLLWLVINVQYYWLMVRKGSDDY